MPATDQPKCELCGEPMPKGEEMFKFHGYSGPCPKPPIDRSTYRIRLDDYACAKRAYENDPYFRAVVDAMVAMINRLEMTPSDVRAAANFASMLHAQHIANPIKTFTKAEMGGPTP